MTYQPEAIRIADGLDQNVLINPQTSEDEPGGYRSELDELMAHAAAILRSQHARIADLEAQLYAVGAGGVGQSIKPHMQPDTAQAPEVRIQTSAPSAWDWASLNNAADKLIRGKMVWKRFIDGTPLANDIACWMADFALEHAAPPEAPAPQQKPVAWRIHPFDYGISSKGVYVLTTRTEQCEMWERKGWRVEPLYTAPQPARQPLKDDAKRLDWLMLNISGAEFRRIGIEYSGICTRKDIDNAIERENGITESQP
jgi:hypothetical protein